MGSIFHMLCSRHGGHQTPLWPQENNYRKWSVCPLFRVILQCSPYQELWPSGNDASFIIRVYKGFNPTRFHPDSNIIQVKRCHSTDEYEEHANYFQTLSLPVL